MFHDRLTILREFKTEMQTWRDKDVNWDNAINGTQKNGLESLMTDGRNFVSSNHW